MRHGKKFNHLGRKTAHRGAMLSNMASSLIIHKRINTTVAKAKALRKYIEPLLTKSKTDDTHSRRVVFSYLQDKDSVSELFNNVAGKIANRPGGYTRIIKTGARLGDNAEMCMMELVDFNELLVTEESAAKGKTRRSRRGGKSKAAAEAAPKAEEAIIAEAEVVEEAEKAEETVEVVEEATEAPVEEVKEEEVVAETETTEEASTEEDPKGDDASEEEEKKD